MIFIQIRVSCNVSWAAWIGLKWWVCIPYMHPHCGRSHPTAGCPWLIKMNNMPGELTTDPMECLEYLGMSKHRCQPDSNHVTSGGCTCPPVTQITYIEIIAPPWTCTHVFSHRFADNLGITSSARPTYFFQWSKPDSALRFGLRVAKNAAPKTARNRTQRNSVGILFYLCIYNVANPTLQSTPTPILSEIYRLIVIVIRCQPAPLIVAVKTAKRT